MQLIWLPDGGSAARTSHVLDVGNALGQVLTVLVHVGRALPPDPLLSAVLIFPDVIQESVGMSGYRTQSPTTIKPEIVGHIGPSDSAPSRAGDICRRRSSLGAIDAVLIGEVVAGDPRPLSGHCVVLPEVVQNCSLRACGTDGIETESSE